MTYAVFKTGGKQYRASVGDILLVERLQNLSEKDSVTFAEVLLYVSESERRIGNPTVPGITVKGTVIASEKGEKIRVSKFKAKARYRRVIGHRQHLSRVQIDEISESVVKKEEKVIEASQPKTTRRKRGNNQ